MSETRTRFLTDRGDYIVGLKGATVEDLTVRTRALVRSTTPRGTYFADKDLGHRFKELRGYADARARFLKLAKEALKPLLDTGEIQSIELGPRGVWVDSDKGAVFADLLLAVDQETIVELTALPITGA